MLKSIWIGILVVAAAFTPAFARAEARLAKVKGFVYAGNSCFSDSRFVCLEVVMPLKVALRIEPAVHLVARRSRARIVTLRSNSRGRFQLHLPPGEYAASLVQPDGLYDKRLTVRHDLAFFTVGKEGVSNLQLEVVVKE